MKYQSFVINIMNLLGALYLISINLFLILISKLVPLNPENARTLNMFIRLRVMSGNLRIISDSRIRWIIAKGPKYRFPVQIDFQKCREKIAASLNEFRNRWCKREHVGCDALKDWKLNIFKLIDQRFSLHSQNINMLPRKPKISYRYLKSGIEEFHTKYVLVPADKAANNVVVVRRLYYIDTLKQELSGTKAYKQTSEKRKSIINNHIFHNAPGLL